MEPIPRKLAGKTKKQSIDASYNKFKEFEGKQYTGMKIGRSHKWYYNKGEWKETKKTPDLWEFHYNVTKRRAGKAPKGSGAPIGTEYHWLILAHQNVKKKDENSYSTEMTGFKYKVAHKRANKDTWNATNKTQVKRMIQFLQDIIDSLKKEDTSTTL